MCSYANSGGTLCCQLTAVLPQQANIFFFNRIVCKFPKKTNVQRSYFLLVAYRTFLKKPKRTVKNGLLEKKVIPNATIEEIRRQLLILYHKHVFISNVFYLS